MLNNPIARQEIVLPDIKPFTNLGFIQQQKVILAFYTNIKMVFN